MRARSLVAAIGTAAALIGGVALAAPAQADAQSSDTLAKLATLAVKGRAPKTGYDRSLFGATWTDDVTVADGHNGCDTRFLGAFSVLRRPSDEVGDFFLFA